jgi:hypothetical protein
MSEFELYEVRVIAHNIAWDSWWCIESARYALKKYDFLVWC